MAELTVGAGNVRGLLKFAASRGACVRTLAARSGVDPRALEDQDDRVPFPAYVALMRAAKAATGDPALALHYAEHVDFSEISVVGLLTVASETMMDAFRQMNRFGPLAIEVDCDGDRFRHVGEADGQWLVDTRRNANEFPELTETTFGRMAWGTRRFGDTPFVLEVEVTHPDPGYADEYVRIFGAPVRFGAARNAMRIDPAWHGHRIGLLPRYVLGVLCDKAQALMESLESSRTTRGRVESLLMPALHTGETGMERVAGEMGLSRQTLFRKLRAEGVTFEQVLDELRHRLALHYLGGRKVSVNETAYLVGFSEPAAFSRAFKRWTGRSPSDVRSGAWEPAAPAAATP